MSDFSTPTWKQIGDMQEEIDMLHAENALKLTQILDLEVLVYDLRILNTAFDGQPCWCDDSNKTFFSEEHEARCIRARKATEPLWRIS